VRTTYIEIKLKLLITRRSRHSQADKDVLFTILVVTKHDELIKYLNKLIIHFLFLCYLMFNLKKF